MSLEKYKLSSLKDKIEAEAEEERKELEAEAKKDKKVKKPRLGRAGKK